MTVTEALVLATEHYQAGRLAEAEGLFVQVLAVEPANAYANHAMGLIALAVGKNDIAVSFIGKAMAASPQEHAFVNSMGEARRNAGQYEEALACYTRSLALKPDYAEAMNNRALALLGLGRGREALASCEAALKLKPDFAAAWSNRGVMLQELGRLEESLESFDKALALNPGYAEAQANRGTVLRNLGRLDEALAAFDLVLASKPNFLEALDGRGSVLQKLLRTDEALASYGAALRIRPDLPLVNFHAGICMLLTGQYEDGWGKFEYRLQAHSEIVRDFEQPLWLGDRDIAGKKVLLHAEQGLGDTIQFARYVASVKARGAKVVLEVQPALKSLFRGLGASSVVARGDPLPDFDFHCPMPSLPFATETTLKNIPSEVPYLSVEKQAVSAWRRKLVRKGTRLVGLCWKGDPDFPNDRERSMRLADFVPLLDIPGLRFVSLQKELTEEERALVADRNNFGHAGAGFKETAEMVAALDLVITVDTVWAHWAGAIGKPVWVMLAHYPHWCWLLERQDSPWYPTARLFRQTKPGAWGPALGRVKRGLAAFGRRS